MIIETERLRIREIEFSDMESMLELHSDPEVHIYLGNNTISSEYEMTKAIQSLQKQYADYGVGRWAMIEKSSNQFIGWTGLEYVTKEINEYINFYDLGYRIMKQYWGHGYATESATASLQWGFENLDVDTIYGMTDSNNAASQHVLQKVGLTKQNKFIFEGVQHDWFSIDRQDFTSTHS